MNRLFILLIFAVFPVVVFSQTTAKDTTGRNVLLQIEVLARQIDSIKKVATAKNKVANEFSSKSNDVAVRLQMERKATHYDRQLFIDTLLHRIVRIVGKAEFTSGTILQFDAIRESMGKALNVHTPGEIKSIDTLMVQFKTLDKQRETAWRAFDDELIMLDKYMEELDRLKKTVITRAAK